MYTTDEQTIITLGAKQKFTQLISDAILKDNIGCRSVDHWTLGFHIYSILKVLKRSLTAVQDNNLYEILVEYNNKRLN